MSQGNFTGQRTAACFLAAALATALRLAALPAHSALYASDTPSANEQALRTRVEELYTAVRANDWTKVESYLTEQSKETFRSEPKHGLQGFGIQSVKLDPDGQTATVVVDILVFAPNAPSLIPVAKTTRWRLINQVWYAELAKPNSHLPQSLNNPPPKSGLPAAPVGSKELKFQSAWAGVGYIHDGEVKLARFPFTNISKHAVTLGEIQTGSDCLRLKSQQKEFQPGETAVLEFELDSSCLGSISGEQGISFAVLLKTEPEGAYVKLIISGRLVPGKANPTQP